MRISIAISCVLIAASAGAGLALSAVHKATFTPAPVSALTAPAVTDRTHDTGDFVIPTYVPVAAAPVATAPAPLAELDVTHAAVIQYDTGPVETGPKRPQLRPDWEYVATTRHLDDEVLKLPKRAAQPVRTAYIQPAATPRAVSAPSANAPMIVSHVSAQNFGGGPTQPDYAHGVYR